MFNRIVCLIIFLFTSVVLLAQVNYVEVSVNDTAIIPADQFVYRIDINPDISAIAIDTAAAKLSDYYQKRAEMIRKKQKEIRQEILSKIETAGFHTAPQTLVEALAKNDYTENNLQFFINSADSLRTFISIIKNEKSIRGNLLTAKSKNEEASYNILYKKLLTKARKRAEYLAALTNKKVISVISITDNRNYVSGWGTYPSFYFPSADTAQNFEDKVGNALYSIQNTITIRFSIK